MRIPVTFRAELLSPLVIARGRRERVHSSLDYIPGTSLRGAILSAYMMINGKDEVFERLLSPGRNVFPFLWPGPEGALPFARSAVSCKRHGAAHGLSDVLVPHYKALAAVADVRELEQAMKCPKCGEDRKPHQGYRRGGAELPRPISTSRMNVGIDRRRLTAAPHILFGAEAIEPVVRDGERWKPLDLTGLGWIEEEDLEVIEQISSAPLFIGKMRSRGYGRTKLRVTRREPLRRAKEIANRIDSLTARCGGGARYFTLDVVAPLIAYDRFLRAVSDPSEWLPKDLEAESVDAMAGTTIVAGWDMAARMPKDDEEAVAPGSAILARSKLSRDELARRLVSHEESGIGERRGEGFGRVVANDGFH